MGVSRWADVQSVLWDFLPLGLVSVKIISKLTYLMNDFALSKNLAEFIKAVFIKIT